VRPLVSLARPDLRPPVASEGRGRVSFEISRAKPSPWWGVGCRKSALAGDRGLYHPTAGNIYFQGKSLEDPSAESPESRPNADDLQDPYASLDPAGRFGLSSPSRSGFHRRGRSELRNGSRAAPASRPLSDGHTPMSSAGAAANFHRRALSAIRTSWSATSPLRPWMFRFRLRS
jgi:hypothetical protein